MGIRISFIGDVTCDRPMLRAALRSDGLYEFDRMFAPAKGAWAGSDLVVGNLETVCAGRRTGFNPRALCYNSPDELLQAAGRAGIRVLTTANNHSLDCGGEGLRRTLHMLDENNILHTGAVSAPDVPTEKRYLVCDVGGIRVAIAAFTDAMNPGPDGLPRPRNEWEMLNQLKAYPAVSRSGKIKALMKRVLPMQLFREMKTNIKRRRGIPTVKSVVDDYSVPARDEVQLQRAADILKEARADSDFVIACIHAGGQFNTDLGRHSREIYDRLAPYADLMVGHHPHVIQRIEHADGKLRAYSLGGFSMSPDAEYVHPDVPSEFSALLHVELERRADGKVICSGASCTVLHTVEEKTYVTIHPVNEEYYHGQIEGSPTQPRLEQICRVLTGEERTRCWGEFPVMVGGEQAGQSGPAK